MENVIRDLDIISINGREVRTTHLGGQIWYHGNDAAEAAFKYLSRQRAAHKLHTYRHVKKLFDDPTDHVTTVPIIVQTKGGSDSIRNIAFIDGAFFDAMLNEAKKDGYITDEDEDGSNTCVPLHQCLCDDEDEEDVQYYDQGGCVDIDEPLAEDKRPNEDIVNIILRLADSPGVSPTGKTHLLGKAYTMITGDDYRQYLK